MGVYHVLDVTHNFYMEYQLDIQGYYRDESRKDFPNVSGIYFVYRGVLIPHLKTVTLTELIYIGESEDINNRLQNHEKRNDFLSLLQRDEELFYSFAITDDLSNSKRERLETALIYELKPTLNIKSSGSFGYGKITINVLGDRHAYIPNKLIAPSY